MTTRVLQLDILLSGLRDPDTGEPLNGGTVYFYASGTTTPKAVWSDKLKVTAVYSVLLDSNGSVSSPYYGDGWYKLVVKDSDGNTEYTWDDVYIQSAIYSLASKTADYTATPDDDMLICTGTFTLSLADVATFTHPLWVKVVDGSSITLDPYSTQQVEGQSTVVLTHSVVLYPDLVANTWRSDYINITATDVAFVPNGTGAVSRSVESKLDERITVQDFGAVGDGTTDDSAAFIAALAAHDVVYVPYTSDGYSLGTTTVTVGDKKFLIGENQVRLKTGADVGFYLTGYDERNGISDFTIDMTTAVTGSCAIKFKTGDEVVWGSRINKIRFEECWMAIGDDLDATHYVVDIDISDIQCRYARGQQIYISKSRGFMPIRDVFIDNTLKYTGDYVCSWVSAKFTDFQGLELTRFDVVGQVAVLAAPAYDAGVRNIEINGVDVGVVGNRFVWLDRVRSESSVGVGIWLEDIAFLWAHWLEAFSSIGYGIYCEGLYIAQGDNWQARGVDGESYEEASADGIVLDTCNMVTITNVSTHYNTGNGVLVDDSLDCSLLNVVAHDNSLYGIGEAGTSDRNTYTGNLDDNTSGGYSLAGGLSVVRDTIVSSATTFDRIPNTPTCSFVAHRNDVDQTGVTPNSDIKVAWTTTHLDYGGYFDTGDARWTPPVGTYRIGATVQIKSGVEDASDLRIMIFKDGTKLHEKVIWGNGTDVHSLMIDCIDVADGTNYYEVFVHLGATGNKTIDGTYAASWFYGVPI